VRETGATGMQTVPGGGYGGGPTSAAPSTPHAGGKGQAAQKDMANWREVSSYTEQRMDAVAQRIPPSDLRQAVNNYADEIRSQAIGGGPGHPPSMMPPPSGGSMSPPSGQPMPPPSGMPHSAPPPSGTTTPGHGGGGMAPPPGGTAPPGGGAPSPTTPEPSNPPENPSYP